MQLHHVQLSCAPGGEDAQRRFYCEGLGLAEVGKPAALAGRGGCWFRSGQVEIHIGVEAAFTPAVKAHPALLVDDEQELDRLARRVARLGFDVDHTERTTFAGMLRFHTRDGAGNRVEIMTPARV